MPEHVKLTTTPINAEVDILAMKEEKWGVEVIARVTDLEGKERQPSLLGHAVALACKQKFDLSLREGAPNTNVISTIPDDNQAFTWWCCVRVFTPNKDTIS